MKRAFLLLLLFSLAFGQLGEGKEVLVPETLPPHIAVDIPASEIGAMPPSPSIRPPAQPCEECPTDAEIPFLFSSVNLDEKKVSSSIAVEHGGRRVPVEGASLFFQIFDKTGHMAGMCKAYTNSRGIAEFSYEGYDCDEGCSIKISFCCSNPVTQSCVLPSCIGSDVSDFSSIAACAGYGGSWPSATVGGEEIVISPMFDIVHVPPKETSSTAIAFTLCLPLLAVFGFLGAAMFASGRDPFAMFSFYTPRYTRGAERPIGARGITLNITTLVNIIGGELIGRRIKKALEDEAEAEIQEAAGASPEPPGRVRTATGEGRREAAHAEARAAAPQQSAGREAARESSRPSDTSTKADLATGTLVQRFLKGIIKLIRGDPSEINRLFAEMSGSLRVSGADAGMKAPEFFARLGGILVQYLMPIWIVGEITSEAIMEAIEVRVAGERNATYCVMVIPALERGTVALRDKNGNVIGYKIEFYNPLTGRMERHRFNKEEGELFLSSNKYRPMEIAQMYNMRTQCEKNDQCVNAAAEDYKKNCGMMGETAFRGLWASESEEVRDAEATLLDANATKEAKLAAFERIIAAEGPTSEAAILGAAVLCSGMSYADIAALVAGSREFHFFIAKIGSEDFSAMTSKVTTENSGNIIAAISILRGVFKNALETREGREANQDPIALGWTISRLGVEIQQSDPRILRYREGTEHLASMAIAEGMADIAASSDVASMSWGNRADIEKAYQRIIAAREEFLGRQMTEEERRNFVPLTEEGREVFAKMQEIRKYDAMCSLVAETINEIRQAARDPALAERDPIYAGLHSTYEEIQRQAATQGIQEIADDVISGRRKIGDVQEEKRRVDAYTALGMLSAETASLASQAVATEAEGRLLYAIGQLSARYDMLHMDMSAIAKQLAETARRNYSEMEAEYRERGMQPDPALNLMRERALFFESTSELIGKEGGPADADWIGWARRIQNYQYNMTVGPVESQRGMVTHTIDMLGNPEEADSASQQLEIFGGQAGQAFQNEFQRFKTVENDADRAAALEGMRLEANRYFDHQREERLSTSTRMEEVEQLQRARGGGVVRDYTFKLIEEAAAEELREIKDILYNPAPSNIYNPDRNKAIMQENLAMQVAHACQTRFATDESIRDALARAMEIQQDFAQHYRETETGAVLPREQR